MKALMKERPEPGLTLVDVPMPVIAAPDDVLVKVEYCAICVGETKVYDWNEWAANDKTLQLPTVMGHEACGIVAEIGPGVTQFKPGDRIVNDPIIACGFCRHCRAGYVNMCENREILGKRRGAFAEYIVLPERVLCHLPDKLTLEEGAVLENFGIAVHAVDVEQHDPGDWAVIIGGGGPIGILAAQTLRAYGVNTVVTEIAEPRLEFARQHTNGAIVVDAKKEDPVRAGPRVHRRARRRFRDRDGRQPDRHGPGVRHDPHPRHHRHHRHLQRAHHLQPILQDDAARDQAAEHHGPTAGRPGAGWSSSLHPIWWISPRW